MTCKFLLKLRNLFHRYTILQLIRCWLNRAYAPYNFICWCFSAKAIISTKTIFIVCIPTSDSFMIFYYLVFLIKLILGRHCVILQLIIFETPDFEYGKLLIVITFLIIIWKTLLRTLWVESSFMKLSVSIIKPTWKLLTLLQVAVVILVLVIKLLQNVLSCFIHFRTLFLILLIILSHNSYLWQSNWF